MNPQERAVIDGIFDRLKGVANQPRDPDAERHIADLVRQQPYAPYAMAQSIYVQEQALLNQQQQIDQLQAEVARLQQAQTQAAPQSGGFLSGLFGGGATAPRQEPPAYGQRGPQGNAPQPMAPQSNPGPWGQQAAPQQQQGGPWGQQAAPQRQGMGFLGTAAAAAAGVAGGMMIGNILSSAFGGGQAHAAPNNFGLGGSPFGGQGNSQGFLQQDAQANDGTQEEDEGYDDTDAGYDDGGGDDSYEA